MARDHRSGHGRMIPGARLAAPVRLPAVNLTVPLKQPFASDQNLFQSQFEPSGHSQIHPRLRLLSSIAPPPPLEPVTFAPEGLNALRRGYPSCFTLPGDRNATCGRELRVLVLSEASLTQAERNRFKPAIRLAYRASPAGIGAYRPINWISKPMACPAGKCASA